MEAIALRQNGKTNLLKQIFADHWPSFMDRYWHRIRDSVFENVDKMLRCGTASLCSLVCPDCGFARAIPMTCKSRFCSSCGHKATNNWIHQSIETFLKAPYQHITFTIPEQLRLLARTNRRIVFNIMFQAAKNTVLETCKILGYRPGIMTVMHTFGKDLKFHPHIHLVVTCGGLSPDRTQWRTKSYLPHQVLKKKWKYHVTRLLRRAHKKGLLQLKSKNSPDSSRFNDFLDELYERFPVWYVNLQKPLDSHTIVVSYVARYAKRPAIAISRIRVYDGWHVSLDIREKSTGRHETCKLDVMEFIGRVVTHIHDKHFRVVRYAGLFATRCRKTLLPLARTLLKMAAAAPWICPNWKQLIIRTFHFDPTRCPRCHQSMDYMREVWNTS